ncbi:MAG: substrate-binding domain-containing protein, partial [Planctomycetes bacterium]|nr:substrate-binding domain-containing protein [Planctomycetota bacterium]
LTIVVAAGNPHRIAGLADLQRTGLLVALCGPRVPAGAYARAACARAGVELHSRSDEPSVKAVVTKVRLGEFDAGIVYATDLLGVAGVEAVPIRPEQNVEVELCIAASANGRGRLAADFVAFALADAGRRALAASGFVLP